jgi:hypothetical protein
MHPDEATVWTVIWILAVVYLGLMLWVGTEKKDRRR